MHIASLEADADGDFGSEDVGDAEFAEEFHDNQTGEYLDQGLVAQKRSSSWRRSGSRMRWRSRSAARRPGGHREATDQHPMGGCEERVNGESGCPMQARSDIFAAMPPLEAKKLLFRKAVGGRKELRNGEWCQQKIMLIDVKKAHLYGELEDHESAFVLPPDGECEQGKCWRLRRWLCGMRPAASAWEKHFSKTLVDMGFANGVTAATVFCVVHGDDFTFLGWEEDLHDVRDGMNAKYELKVRGVLGGEWGDQREVTTGGSVGRTTRSRTRSTWSTSGRS